MIKYPSKNKGIIINLRFIDRFDRFNLKIQFQRTDTIKPHFTPYNFSCITINSPSPNWPKTSIPSSLPFLNEKRRSRRLVFHANRKGTGEEEERKKRLTARGRKGVIWPVFESLNCVICMETRPVEYQRADFSRNFTGIKRTGK